MASTDTSLPIDERILDHVVETLHQVNRVDPQYHCDLNPQRAKQLPESLSDGLAVAIAGDPIPREGSPLGKQDWTLPVAVFAVAIEPERSEMPLGQRLRIMSADIRAALKRDNTRGGLSIKTDLSTTDQIQQTAPGVIVVKVEIWYRTTLNDPYSL